MAQAGYTPIQLYLSTTASAVPSAGNLANGELAINITDGKLFYKDNGGVVQVLATKGAGTIGGSNTQVQYNNAGALAGSANLTFDGTTLTAAGLAGPHNGTVGATTPNTGAFTTLSASSTVSGAGFSTYFASPPAIGGTAANTGAFTTLTVSNAVTLSGGTANGVPYLNASKVLTSGSALTFDGSALGLTGGTGIQLKMYNSGLTGTQASSIGVGKSETSGNTAFFGWGNNSGAPFGYVETYGQAAPFQIGGSDVRFQVASSEQMRLTSTGLGIGTSSPSVKLDVASTGNTVLALRSTVSGSPAYYIEAGGAGTPSFVYKSGQSLRFATADDSAYTNYVERMRLDTSGNLGLGVTPSAWSGYGAVLQMQNGGAFVNNALNDVHVANNCYYNAGWKYTATNASSRYEQFNGGHYWFNAPSGTAGNAITFTQAMTLTSGGSLLIATTSDLGRNLVIGGTSTTARVVPATDNVGYVGDATFRWQAVYAINGTIQTSDGREKNTIKDSNLGLAFVNSLRPVSYKWNVGENIVTYDENGKEVVTPRPGVRTHYGFIAQEVKAAIPDGVDFGGFVEEPNDGPMSLRYHEFIGPLVKAIQELKASLDEVKLEFDAYKAAHP